MRGRRALFSFGAVSSAPSLRHLHSFCRVHHFWNVGGVVPAAVDAVVGLVGVGSASGLHLFAGRSRFSHTALQKRTRRRRRHRHHRHPSSGQIYIATEFRGGTIFGMAALCSTASCGSTPVYFFECHFRLNENQVRRR